MHLKVTEAAKSDLRHMAEQGSTYAPLPNAASELVALGFAASNDQGGVRITAEGRKFLRDIDAGLEF
jgi:predicted transcriptional regulator